MICIFHGGPRNGQSEDYPSAVPPQRISVFADPPEGMMCADEQVITLLGKYDRVFKATDGYHYEWLPV